MKLPQLTDKDDIKKLRKTYDRVETHIISLQSLGVDSKDYGPLLAACSDEPSSGGREPHC